jgi:hypothetical protein
MCLRANKSSLALNFKILFLIIELNYKNNKKLVKIRKKIKTKLIVIIFLVDGALSGQVLLMIYSYRTRRAHSEYIYSSGILQ